MNWAACFCCVMILIQILEPWPAVLDSDRLVKNRLEITFQYCFITIDSCHWTPNLLLLCFRSTIIGYKNLLFIDTYKQTATNDTHKKSTISILLFLHSNYYLLPVHCPLIIKIDFIVICQLFRTVILKLFLLFSIFFIIESHINSASGRNFHLFSSRPTDTRHKMRQIYFITISFHFWALCLCFSTNDLDMHCSIIIILLFFFVPLHCLCECNLGVKYTHTHELKSTDIILGNLHKI